MIKIAPHTSTANFAWRIYPSGYTSDIGDYVDLVDRSYGRIYFRRTRFWAFFASCVNSFGDVYGVDYDYDVTNFYG